MGWKFILNSDDSEFKKLMLAEAQLYDGHDRAEAAGFRDMGDGRFAYTGDNTLFNSLLCMMVDQEPHSLLCQKERGSGQRPELSERRVWKPPEQ